jgi:phosphoglucosamine mutase
MAPLIFRDLGAEVIVINNQPDGLNINDKAGSTNLAGLSARVLKEKADLGVAYDGDADRLMAIDENGEIVDGDQLLYISGKQLANKGKLKRQVVVVTLMSNLGLHKSFERIGISTRETQVGDRYVLEEMVESDYNLGGEQSGHLIFLDHNTTGDGILSSLMLADILIERGEKLSVLVGEMEKYPQILKNIRLEDRSKLIANEKIDAAVVKANKYLDPVGRVVVRLSGTEPLLRVMVEGISTEQIELVMEELMETIKAEL